MQKRAPGVTSGWPVGQLGIICTFTSSTVPMGSDDSTSNWDNSYPMIRAVKRLIARRGTPAGANPLVPGAGVR